MAKFIEEKQIRMAQFIEENQIRITQLIGENLKTNPKHFWKYVSQLRKKDSDLV
jgi:hypothetical protein